MAIFKFLFYSILGILAFLAPFKIGEESSILMGHIKSIIIDGYIEEIRVLVVIVSCVTILGTILGFIKRDFKNKYFQEFFVCGPINGTARILGAIFFLMVHYGVVPRVFQGCSYQAAVMDIGACDRHSQRNTLTVHMEMNLAATSPSVRRVAAKPLSRCFFESASALAARCRP